MAKTPPTPKPARPAALPASSVGSPPALRDQPDLQRLFDALSFFQAPISANRLVDFLAASQVSAARGSQLHGGEVRRLLGELRQLGLVETDPQAQWWVNPEAGWQRFAGLVRDDAARAQWWAGWRRHMQFDNSWRLELFSEPALVAAVRVVVFAGGSAAAFERLCRLSTNPSPRLPARLAMALLVPWDEGLWNALDPELQLPLLQGLLALPAGDTEAVTAPLWAWLRAQGQADAGRLHDFARQALAQRLLLAGQADEAEQVVHGLDDSEADAVRAAAWIVRGQWAVGAEAFEAALKLRSAATGKRKQLMPEALTWLYALALLAREQPAQWAAARKFVAAEAGKRDADPYTFWGLWQAAIDQRLGDAPRQVSIFRLGNLDGWQQQLSGLHQLSHLLLAAWLGHRVPQPEALRAQVADLDTAWQANGLPWLAGLARRCAAQLLDQAPAAADAQRPFPISAAPDRWREALNAIVALGPVGGAAAGAAAEQVGPRLLWLVRADDLGRVRAVEVLEQKAGTRGLGKPKPVSLATLVKRQDLPAHDAAVLRAAKKAPYGARYVLDRMQAVQALVRHPHVAWHDAPAQAIEINEGLPRLEVLTQGAHLQFKVLDPIRPEDLNHDTNDEDDDDGHTVYLSYRRQAAEPERPPVLLLREDAAHARLVRVTPAQRRVAELVTQGWQVPSSARAEMDAALRVLGTHFQLASDADTGHEVAASAVLRAELTPQREGLQLNLVATPFGDFGPRLPPGTGRQRVTTVHQGVTLSTQRDLPAERARRQALLQAVPWLDEHGHAWSLDEPEQALALVEALASLAPEIVSEWPKGRGLRVRSVSAAQVSLRVKRHQQWLTLDGELQLDGDEVLRIERLLTLVQSGQRRYIALGDGDFLALTDTLRQQLADLAALSQAHAQGPRLSALAAMAWAGQAGAPALQGDADWTTQCESWAAAQAVQHALPAGLQAELRDYQQAGWQWLMRLAASGFGAVLADDMGLGKTLQTLALLAARAAGGPALVVAPTSVCGNWLAEATRFTPGLRFRLYGDGSELPPPDDDDSAGEATASNTDADAEVAAVTTNTATNTDTGTGTSTSTSTGTDTDTEAQAGPAADRLVQRRRQVQALGPGDVLVCSYGLLQLDGAILAGRHWHSVVLDEAQAIKNAATRRAKAALALKADFRVALTGTPVENRLAELWSIMAFANPGLLGSAELFNQRFAGPIERDGDTHTSRRLRRLVAPFVLRRTKTEVLADLPPRTEIVHEVVPGSRERALLEALRRQAEEQVSQVLDDGAPAGQAQLHILAALTRLRRAACDPRLVAPELGLVGAKVQAFEQLAQELVAGRHKALVFSQFTDFLALLRERLDAAGLSYQYLDGSTPAAQRTQRVNRFQAGEGDFFLISLKAGGFGLNLTMADYVIIADPWWNPAAEDQASGRAHRIGQQRPVTVYRLVTQGSIESRIVQLHQSKRDLADSVLTGQDGEATRSMGAAEMLALLRGDDPPADSAAD